MVFEGKGRTWRPTRWNDLFGLWRERALSGNQGLLAFYPLLACSHEFGFVAAAVGNGFADDDADRAGVFEEGISRPKLAAVERDGDDVHLKHFGHTRAAELVAAFLTGRQACAFGENGNPIAFVLRARPCSISCLLASRLLLRSMPMVLTSFKPQPKKGILKSSRLAT